MSFTNLLELKVLDHLLGPAPYTAPGTVYVGLSTTTPLDDGSNFTEPAVGGYARVAVVNNATNWPAASAGTKRNGTTITFPIATAPWGTVTYAGIFDLATGGNLLMFGQLATPKTIATDDNAQFNPNSIAVTLD